MERFPSSFIPKQMTDWLTDWLVKVRQNNQRRDLPPWPSIVVSHDDPPDFESKKEPYDFETWLGCYCWRSGEVTLWQKGIVHTASDLKIPYVDLLNAVLIHELGHWFNHRAPVGTGTCWDEEAIDRYKYCRRYDEAWAQMFVWRYGLERDAGVLAAFQSLEPRQSEPYKAWRELLTEEQNLRQNPFQSKVPERFLRGLCGQGEQFGIFLSSLEDSRPQGRKANLAGLIKYLDEYIIKKIKRTVSDDEEDDISNW